MLEKTSTMLSALLVAWTVLTGSPTASAAVIGFDPSSSSVALGDPVAIDVVVDPEGTLIGAYDVILGWNPSILAAAVVTPNPGFALGLSAPDVDASDVPLGSLSVFDVSLEFDLTPFQNGIDPIVLFTVEFATLAPGTSALSLTPNIVAPGGPYFLADELALPVTTQANGGSVTVQGAAQVPAPPTWLLVACGGPIVLASRRLLTRSRGGAYPDLALRVGCGLRTRRSGRSLTRTSPGASGTPLTNP